MLVTLFSIYGASYFFYRVDISKESALTKQQHNQRGFTRSILTPDRNNGDLISLKLELLSSLSSKDFIFFMQSTAPRYLILDLSCGRLLTQPNYYSQLFILEIKTAVDALIQLACQTTFFFVFFFNVIHSYLLTFFFIYARMIGFLGDFGFLKSALRKCTKMHMCII